MYKNKMKMRISGAADRSSVFMLRGETFELIEDGEKGRGNDRELISSCRGEEAEQRVPEHQVKNMEMKKKGVERQIKTGRGWRVMVKEGRHGACAHFCVFQEYQMIQIELLNSKTLVGESRHTSISVVYLGPADRSLFPPHLTLHTQLTDTQRWL